MSLSREFHRGERRLWIGPTAMTGPEIREACTPPRLARIGAFACFSVVVLVVSVGMAALDWPFLAALPIFVVLLIGTVMALQAYIGDRRRRYGMVQVPLTTWDLIVALGQVAPESVLEARRLQDRLVAVIASPGYRDGEVAAIEARMSALVTGAPSVPA
jgi:branched-subunit amino acid ABC-type transport system permease component